VLIGARSGEKKNEGSREGYGNSRVHKYTPDGKLLYSWGSPGTNPGEFNIAHNITCDGDGWVYVADRENHRVQVFDGNGKYETQWTDMHRPSGLFMTPGKCPLCYIAELGPHLPVNLGHPNIGPRISVWQHTGKQVARVQAEPVARYGARAVHLAAWTGCGFSGQSVCG
jgi:hypothetical protein